MSANIVGYVYRAETYDSDCLVAYGELSPAALDMSTEIVLDQHAAANAIDRYDEYSFPKVLFSVDVDADTCGACGEPLYK